MLHSDTSITQVPADSMQPSLVFPVTPLTRIEERIVKKRTVPEKAGKKEKEIVLRKTLHIVVDVEGFRQL